MRCVLALASLIAIAVAAPAGAASRAFPVSSGPPVLATGGEPSLGGPFLAGDEVLFVERRRGEVALVADGPAGRRTLGAFEDVVPEEPRVFGLDVAEGRVAFTSFRFTCSGDPTCVRNGFTSPARFEMRTGPAAGELRTLEGCGLLTVDAAAGALTGRCGTGYAVHEDGAPSRHVAVAQVPVAPRVAGDLLAEPYVEDGLYAGLRVLRRATGEEVLRLGAPVETYDLAPDGTLAYALPGEAAVGWSSPQDPAVHRIAVPDAVRDVKIDGPAIAVRTGATRARRMQVLDRAGTVFADVTEPAPEAGFHLDAGRLTWARRPCSRQSIVVWDLAEPAPVLPGEDCTMPELEGAPLRIRRATGVLSVPLRCPATAPAGCAGLVALTVTARTRAGRLRLVGQATHSFDLLPGGESTLRVRLISRRLKRARSAALDADFELLRMQKRRVRRSLRFR